jgi:hypothetical protein
MRHISLAIIALVLAANASAEKCVEKTEPYEGKSVWWATCVAPVEDVIKTDLDGYLVIHYIVRYKGQRFIVEDPLIRTEYAVGEQICFTVGKAEVDEPRYPNWRRVYSIVVKAPNEECQKITKGPGTD